MKPILRGVAASAVLSFTLSMGVLTPAAARTGHPPAAMAVDMVVKAIAAAGMVPVTVRAVA